MLLVVTCETVQFYAFCLVYCSMTVFGIVVGLTVVAYGVYCLCMRYVKKRCTCKTDLTGKTVIITGSDKGENYGPKFH